MNGGMQWDERHYLELMGGKELTPHEKYLLGRDAPAPYTPPPPAPSEQPKVIDYQMKRAGAAIGFTTVCGIALIAAEQGAFTAAAAVLANVLAWGAGIGVVVVILRTAFSWKPEKHETVSQPPPGNSEEWEFYQRQEQGRRKKQ